MALDRDIYWVGRQWAVTGLGIQLVDQRLKGAFDIDASRVWDDDISERMRAHAWLKVDDFDKALVVARERFAEPPKKCLSLVESVLEMIQPASAEEKPTVRQPEALAVAREVVAAAPVPVTPPAPAIRTAPALALRIDHASAKFLPQWTIRTQSRAAARR
jgi:hypothetical protein